LLSKSLACVFAGLFYARYKIKTPLDVAFG